MILKYMDKWYTPQNMVVVAVGDFETSKALATIKRLVRDFPRENRRHSPPGPWSRRKPN